MTRGNHRIVKHGISRFIYIYPYNICYQRDRAALEITFTLFSYAYPIVSSNLINMFMRKKKKIKTNWRREIEKKLLSIVKRGFIPVNWKFRKNTGLKNL